uniref:Caspase-8 n=1 Tax=Cynoglossus semilaevis TaxID=244447 RepID=A0A3P8WSJ9_CYNSE
MMDFLTLCRIDDQLSSSEVEELCFLCRDFVNKKHLEKISDAKELFIRLQEVGLLENWSQEETDAVPVLSPYRKMLYKIYDDMTKMNLKTYKFLLGNRLERRQIEASKTALDLFAELEQAGFLSGTNVSELHRDLLNMDQQLAMIVQRYMEQMAHVNDEEQPRILPRINVDYERSTISSNPQLESMSESRPSYENTIYSDAHPNQSVKPLDKTDFYSLDHNPHGLCVVFNNEKFRGGLGDRPGTQEDSKGLRSVFTRLGFTVLIYDNLTADGIRSKLAELSKNNFVDHDALVVCVLSHGDVGCIYGTNEQRVLLRELTQPFKSCRVPTLAGKPKLFFIQACQGNAYQGGVLPCPPNSKEEEEVEQTIEEDAGPIQGETVPWDADFLLGMATVPECRSFRNIYSGSIYIQELCKQLLEAAESPERDDILTVLTRVNRNVSKGLYKSRKQMPEPKYTLTKKLVLRFV